MDVNQCVADVRSCGEKAARARHYRDESLAAAMTDHYRKVVRMFTESDDRAKLESAFRDAYKAEAESYNF